MLCKFSHQSTPLSGPPSHQSLATGQTLAYTGCYFKGLALLLKYMCYQQSQHLRPECDITGPTILGVGLSPTLTFTKVFGNLSMNECSRPSAQWVPWRKRVILSLLWPVSAYPFIVMYDCDIQCVVTRQTDIIGRTRGWHCC